MSIDVTTTAPSQAAPTPRIRARVVAPAGREWSLHGRSGYHEWQAAHGTGTGGAQWATDPMAPLGAEIVYELHHGGVVESSSPVMRPSIGSDLVTSVDGRTQVRAVRLAGEGDPWEFVQRPSVLSPSGQFMPHITHDVAAAGPGGAELKTVGADTRAMVTLARAGQTLVVLHDAGICETPGCDVAPSILVTLTRVSASRGGDVDRATRIWPLTWIESAPDWQYAAPVVVCDDVPARWGTWDAVATSVATCDDLAAGDWL